VSAGSDHSIVADATGRPGVTVVSALAVGRFQVPAISLLTGPTPMLLTG